MARFRSDIEQFLTIELISEATRPEPLETPRRKGTKYVAFVDPAGGGADEFTLAIGHEEKQTVVVDLVRGRKGNPAAITADFAELCKDFRIRKVYGDRYSGEWARTEFRRHGLAYLDAPGTRSELYLSLLPAMSAGRVELPPCPTLERQLVGLERRTTRAGRDIIDHAPGANDDRANAVAGLGSTAGDGKGPRSRPDPCLTCARTDLMTKETEHDAEGLLRKNAELLGEVKTLKARVAEMEGDTREAQAAAEASASRLRALMLDEPLERDLAPRFVIPWRVTRPLLDEHFDFALGDDGRPVVTRKDGGVPVPFGEIFDALNTIPDLAALVRPARGAEERGSTRIPARRREEDNKQQEVAGASPFGLR